jgi:hypothetical protein
VRINEDQMAIQRSSRGIIVTYTIIVLAPILLLAFPAFLAFVLAFFIGLAALVVQEQIVSTFNFTIVYTLMVGGERVAKLLGLGTFVMLSVVITSPVIFAPLVPFIVPMLQITAAAVVASQYGNVFCSFDLTVLCLRQTEESKDSISKTRWTHEALRMLKGHAADFGLELDTSRVEKHLGSSLFDRQDIGSEIQSLLACLSKGTSISDCLKAVHPTLRDIDIFVPRKGTIERYLEYVEEHYESLLVILAIVGLALKR